MSQSLETNNKLHKSYPGIKQYALLTQNTCNTEVSLQELNKYGNRCSF